MGIYCLSRYLGRKPVFAVVFLCLFFQVAALIHLHPLQNVYFNRLVSHEPEYLRRHYERDYWGLSYKQSLEYVLAHDTAQLIRIAYDLPPCNINTRILFEHSRLLLVDDPGQADYYIVNYRGHPCGYDQFLGKEFHSIIVNNSRINAIFKLKD